MPYDMSNPPDKIKGMPEHCMKIWITAFNAALKEYNGDEGKANATAYAAVEKAGYKEMDGKWMKGMMERNITAINSPFAFEVNLGRKFAKEVVVEGDYVHPQDYKTKLSITVDRMKEWINNFQKKLVDIVYVPLGHPHGGPENTVNNTGVIDNLYMGNSEKHPGKKALFAVFDIRKDDIAEQVGKTILGCSIGVEDYLSPETGKNMGEILSHIALTNEPFMQGLGEFKMAFSQENATIKPFTFQVEKPQEKETVNRRTKAMDEKEVLELKAKLAELEKKTAEDAKVIELAKKEKSEMERANFEREISSEIEKLVLSNKVLPADKKGETDFAISLGREKGVEYVSRLAKKANVVDTTVISKPSNEKPDSVNAEMPKLSELQNLFAEAVMNPSRTEDLKTKWNAYCEKAQKANGIKLDIPLFAKDGVTRINAER